MKYCGHCGYQIDDNLSFCPHCGQRVDATSQGDAQQQANAQNPNPNTQGQGIGNSFIHKLNEYVGNQEQTSLNWKMLFTDVTKKHTTEEAEEVFIGGTTTTTPALSEVSREWPHPWLYSRVFLMFAITFGLLYICCKSFENVNAFPGLIVVGSFAVPISTLVLFTEVNAFRDISMYKVLQVFFVGGCASLVATLIIFSITDWDFDDNYAAAISIGVIEELGKAIIVFFFLNKMNKKTILGGLLIGASVGAGFAAFESAGYAFQILLGGGWDMMMDVIFLRGILAPGGHVAWAAITGAAFVLAAKAANGQYTTNLFVDGKFLRLFILPVAMHAAWDSPLSAEIVPEVYLFPICLTVFAWIIILILINMGLGEVKKLATAEKV